jgi:phytoene synthase
VTSLEQSYRRCRALNRRHGTTYYWSTWLLPPAKRPHVHALYALFRAADDIVDTAEVASAEARRATLDRFADRFFCDLANGRSDDPILQAVVHTATTFDLDPTCFGRFFRSMRMDLTVTRYQSFEELLCYTDGSAAVIGEMMLPILEPTSSEAVEPARDLGIAFQLTNFWRDVVEDLERGRVYVPLDDIERAGATSALADRRVTPEWVELMRFEVARTRAYYRAAARGLAMLPPDSARCVQGASDLYGAILDGIEAAGYDVFTRRVRVPRWRKLAVGAAGVGRIGRR